MSDKSKIEWTDATWNPVTGCSKVSQGCKNCYALRDWKRLSANPKSVYYGRQFTDVEWHYERLRKPMQWRQPRRVFVNSMSDLFHESIPEHFIDHVFAVMALTPHHTYQILTKRPERMEYYVNDTPIGNWIWAAKHLQAKVDAAISARELPLSNVWLGVSVEDQETAEKRIPMLLQTAAAARWISAEPLLGPINLTRLRIPGVTWSDALSGREHFGVGIACGGEALDWVVAGGESGPGARPSHPDWFRSLRDQCASADVPFHFKQWGEWSPEFDPCRDVARTTLMTDVKGARSGENDLPGYRKAMYRLGKKRAGRLLDGREHNELPAQGDPRA